MNHFVLSVLLALQSASPAITGPCDELLRVAPADAAVVVVVQNVRHHYHQLSQSPFVEWGPTTAAGKRLLDSAEIRQLHESVNLALRDLDTTPETILEEVLGDAIVFAYSPPPTNNPKDERAILLIRPRKIETLRKLLVRVDELQSKSRELNAINRKEHAGVSYFERQKKTGQSEYYCFLGNVFAFSSSEVDIRSLIDRGKLAPAVGDKPPGLAQRMKQLGLTEAVGIVLVNPRSLDADVRARVLAAKPDERRFLSRFAEVWAALDVAAFYLSLDADVQLGVSIRFQPDKLPADLKKWLTGTNGPCTAAGLISRDALLGLAGHIRAVEVLDLIASIAPVEAGKPGVKEFIERSLGPFFGRDKLATVLNSLGPSWAVWAEPPVGESFLPSIVAAIEISGTDEDRRSAEKSIIQGVEFGFQLLRIGYNAKHADQIEFREEKGLATNVVIRSLVNEKGFPPGVQPSFAIVSGYFILATSPSSIRRFSPPDTTPVVQRADRTIAQLSATALRAYLKRHGPRLGKYLTELGVVLDEKSTLETINTLATALELIESAKMSLRSDESGLRIAVRVKLARPLKK